MLNLVLAPWGGARSDIATVALLVRVSASGKAHDDRCYRDAAATEEPKQSVDVVRTRPTPGRCVA